MPTPVTSTSGRNATCGPVRGRDLRARRPPLPARARRSLFPDARDGTASPVALLVLFLPHPQATAGGPPDPQAVAARVGGEPIFLGEVLEGAGSLALVGKETFGEGKGTRQRLLQRLITARLLYLDGRDRRLDHSRLYEEDLHAFADPVLAARYLEQLRRRQTVSEDEIARAWSTGFPAEVKGPDAAQRSRIVQQILQTRMEQVRDAEVARLRQTERVTVHREALAPAGDAARDQLTAVASVGAEDLTWRRGATQLREIPTRRGASRAGGAPDCDASPRRRRTPPRP